MRGFGLNAAVGLVIAALCTSAPAAASTSTSPAAQAVDTPPYGFLPGSTSWTSPTDGWVQGYTSGCGDQDCGFMESTVDGGATWTTRTAPPLDLPDQGAPVRIVFAPSTDGEPAKVGYATGGRVLITEDGGDTWQQVRLQGVSGDFQIGDTVATSRRVYAIIGQGSVESGRTDLYSARIGSHRWRPVPYITEYANGVGVDGVDDIVANGRHVAVTIGRRFYSSQYWTSHNAKDFTWHLAPCAFDQITALGAITAHRAAAMCSYGEDEFRDQHKDLMESTDGGAFTEFNAAPETGYSAEYVSLGKGKDVVSTKTSNGGSFAFRSVDDGWTSGQISKFIRPLLDLQFVDDDHGFMVFGGARSDMAAVVATDDGGVTWRFLDLG